MNNDVSNLDQIAMSALCREMGLTPPPTFTLSPINSPAVLFHWRVLEVIIAQLEPRNRQSLWAQFQYALELSGDETEEEAPALMEVCTENVQVTRQLQTAEAQAHQI